jgi:cytochrome c
MSKSLTFTARYLLIVMGMLPWAVGTTAGLVHAQNLGDVDRGRTLAKAWCAECHLVEKGTFGIFAADFVEVANLPSTTALSLRVFLQSSHKEMPNFSLKPAEADDIIAYILSLKRQ